MQGRGTVKPPTGITFDSDLGNNIDSFLTLAFLQSASGKGDTRVISVSISKACLKSAQAGEAITKFYAGPPPAGGRGFGGGVGVNPEMIGLADNGKWSTVTPIMDAVLSKKAADGKPAYPWLINGLLDTADPGITMRNILLAQFDENAVALLDGPCTDMVGLMDLYGARAADHRESKVPGGSRGRISGRPRTQTSRATLHPRERCLRNGRHRLSRWGARWARRCLIPRPASKRTSPGRRRIRL